MGPCCWMVSWKSEHPRSFISGYATGFIARQVNGETWVQTLHLNVKQAQILSYVYIFRGYIISILHPLSPGNVNSQKIILSIKWYAH